MEKKELTRWQKCCDSIVGIDYWNKIGKDPYDLSGYGYDMDDRTRDLLKLILLVSINAKKGKKKS